MTTAAELIEWLESGGVIASGDPDHVLFLKFEVWESHGKICKYLGVYGWGSSLTNAEYKLKNVLDEPYNWVKLEKEETFEAYYNSAKIALERGKMVAQRDGCEKVNNFNPIGLGCVEVEF